MVKLVNEPWLIGCSEGRAVGCVDEVCESCVPDPACDEGKGCLGGCKLKLSGHVGVCGKGGFGICGCCGVVLGYESVSGFGAR